MLKAGADQGDIVCQRRMGDLYSLALGCDEDFGAAIEYYSLAAEQSDEMARRILESQNMPFVDI